MVDNKNISLDNSDHLYRECKDLIMSLLSDTEYRSSEMIKELYDKTYSTRADFKELNLDQVRYILYILSYQQDFLIKKKKFKLNNHKRTRLIYQEIIKIFIDGDYSIREAYDIYKTKVKSSNMPKSSFSNALRYLCKKGCLKEVGEKYKQIYSYVNNTNINLKLENKLDNNTIQQYVKDKNLTFEEACEVLGTTRGKLRGSLKRTGITWTSRKKKKVRDTKTGQIWETLSECARELGVSKQHVNQSMKRNAPVKGKYLEYLEIV